MQMKLGKMSVTQSAASFTPDVFIDEAKFRFPAGVYPEDFEDAEELLKKAREEFKNSRENRK